MDSADAVAAEAAEPSPAFLKAVTELGAAQTVTTSQPIFNAQGIKLLEGGVRVDQGLYDRLVTHRLSQPLDECLEAEPAFDAQVLREAGLAAIERWPFFARLAEPASVRSALLDALAAVPLPKPLALHLTLARKTRPALFAHSVLMALLCAGLVREGGGSHRETTEAACAGLLHDMGMLHVDPALLAAEERLSGDRLNPVYVHPLTASMLVGRFEPIPKGVARAIVEHHEMLDGSGYPRGLVGDAISPLGRVLSLAEVVTAMFDGEREQPEQRVSLLLRLNPRRYDAALVRTIHRLLEAPVDTDAGDAGASTAVEPAVSIARLLQMSDRLASWRATSAALAPGLAGAQAALIESMDQQNATLQRMLYDAGITPDQLATLGGDVVGDAAVAVELWALAEELLWQLHAAANQLKRRWHRADAARPYPAALAAWLESVAALDAKNAA
jgi:hypothetical protein